MTRPDWCPADVWETATGATALLWTKLSEAQVTAETIARAIIAERERCAEACDAEIELAKQFGPHHVPIISSVRSRIRAGTPCP